MTTSKRGNCWTEINSLAPRLELSTFTCVALQSLVTHTTCCDVHWGSEEENKKKKEKTEKKAPCQGEILRTLFSASINKYLTKRVNEKQKSLVQEC